MRPVRRQVCCSLAGDQRLPAVHIVGPTSKSGVDHDVYGECGDVGRCGDAADWKRGAFYVLL
jgi:hypothetical protein